ncbi:rod shape-determining protein MreC [Rosettibacter firmus]|uniref:rod shape-determining protein MreC n=1 Tax=Rosettibacter firmus TaxID=3111522 RepID=UPI00336BEAC6
MIKFLQRLISNYKEYFLLVILSIISITLLSLNNKPEIKRLRTFAFGNYALLNEILNYPLSIFKNDYSLKELEEENAKLMLEISRLRSKSLENEHLRSMLNFKDTSSFSLISADVISKLVNKMQGNFIINRGSADGVLIGMPVLNFQGLIGIVVDTAKNFSIVRTLYNNNLNIAVTIERLNIDGILNWDGNKLIIKNIPSTYEIKVGDSVVTSDFSTIFPPRIPVGIISKREEVPIGLLHNLTVKPFVDINSVDNIFVLKVIPSKQINQLEMNLLKK